MTLPPCENCGQPTHAAFGGGMDVLRCTACDWSITIRWYRYTDITPNEFPRGAVFWIQIATASGRHLEIQGERRWHEERGLAFP